MPKMRVKCPECKKNVILVKNYTQIICETCELDWEFKEFVMILMQSDKEAIELLADYEKNLEETSESFISWN